MLGGICLVGCANTCFVGFVDNGNGSLTVAAGNPPPACSLTKTNATMRVIAMKSPVCQTCTAAARADHVLVTLRGIQLRPGALEHHDPPEWLEVAPELANGPRQIDLIGDSVLELLMKNAAVPAGSYHEVRLQFLPDSPASAAKLPAENACGDTRWNCVITADGSTKPLRWTDDVPELLMTIQNASGDSLVVFPGAVFDLQLTLQTDQLPYASATEGWKLVTALVGRASVTRTWPRTDDGSAL